MRVRTSSTVAVLEQLPMATVLTCGWMARSVSSMPTTAYGDPPARPAQTRDQGPCKALCRLLAETAGAGCKMHAEALCAQSLTHDTC